MNKLYIKDKMLICEIKSGNYMQVIKFDIRDLIPKLENLLEGVREWITTIMT